MNRLVTLPRPQNPDVPQIPMVTVLAWIITGSPLIRQTGPDASFWLVVAGFPATLVVTLWASTALKNVAYARRIPLNRIRNAES